MIRLRTAADPPDESALAQAAQILRGGGVVAFPTDTLYGLAADPFAAAAVRRVFLLKGRQAERALPLVAADLSQVEVHLGRLPDIGARLARGFWPGPLTLLVASVPTLAAEVTGDTGRVGVRVPAHAVARALCRAAGGPLTATSANRSGEPATADPEVVARALGGALDALVDAGVTPGGPASTIVDVTGGEPRLVRAGAVPWEQLQAYLRQKGED